MVEPSDAPFSEFRVLVVDANPHTQAVLVENLALLGVAAIETANNGQEALGLIRRSPPDLVICDRHMPVMDGLALVRFIRTDSRSPHPDLPVFMMSSAADEPKVLEARDAGINEFLIKPPQMRTLYAHLIALVKNPREFVREDGYRGPDRRRGRRGTYHGPPRRTVDADAAGAGGNAAAYLDAQNRSQGQPRSTPRKPER